MMKTKLLLFIGIACTQLMLAQGWTHIQSLVPTDSSAEPQDMLGKAIARVDSHIFISAYAHSWDSMGQNREFNAGAVYVFQEDLAGSWEMTQKLTARERKGVGFYGWSVAAEGEWAAISTYTAHVDSQGETFRNSGLVEIFHLGSSGLWVYDTTLTAMPVKGFLSFGFSVSISGNQLLVGAVDDPFDVNGQDSVKQAGAAYLYEYVSGVGWQFIQKLVPSDRSEDADFGEYVQLAGDKAIVSAVRHSFPSPNFRTEAGKVFIFEKDSPSGMWVETAAFENRDNSSFTFYGDDISISGDYAMVGSKNVDVSPSVLKAGVVDVYRKNATTSVWEFHQTLQASDASTQDEFGTAIDMNGGIAVIGATAEDHIGLDQDSVNGAGSAYVFELGPTGDWTEIAKINAPTRNRFDAFGDVVHLRGSSLMIGAPLADRDNQFFDAGMAHLFELDNSVEIEEPMSLPRFSILQNPSSRLTIRWNGNSPKPYKLLLMNLMGQTVLETSYSQEAIQEWPVEGVDPGLYIVQLEEQGGSLSHVTWKKI
ncbi:MAG: T9SS type A sorting domain-containing protein [Bacteroidota bacterium]